MAGYIDGLIDEASTEPSDIFKTEYRGASVGWSEDLRRVLSLERRQLDPNNGELAKKWTNLLSKNAQKCDCVERFGFCIKALNSIQGWALEEASKCGGLLAPIGVGHGKTGIDILLSMAMGSKISVLLIPANLREQFLKRDYPQWSVHFNTPNLAGGDSFVVGRPMLHLVSYSELSLPKNSNIFNRIEPDLIIADEGQNLKDSTRSRGKRFTRLFKEKPSTRFCVLSGTMTAKSIKDYAHLANFALREKSPLPLNGGTVLEWSAALDAGEYQAPPGLLNKFCTNGEATARQGFRSRLVTTPGVVATEEGSLGCSLVISEREVKAPAEIQRLIQNVRDTWQRPDGEEADEALQIHAWCRQLACGFYYRWKFVHGETPEEIEEWLLARAAYNKEVREKLKRSKEGLDSPALLWFAAIRYHEQGLRDGNVWNSTTFRRWAQVKGTVEPITEAVWVSDFLVRDAAQWANENKGIVWYEFSEFGRAVAKAAKLPYFGGGDEASRGIVAERGDRSIVASIKSHGTGKNLQRAFSNQLIANPPSDGATWEQLLGRTHRIGQTAEEVKAEVYRHTDEFSDAVDSARRRAHYIYETLGTQQKLCYATFSWG